MKKGIEVLNMIAPEINGGRMMYLQIYETTKVGTRYYINKYSDRDACAILYDREVTGIDIQYGDIGDHVWLDGKEFGIIDFTGLALMLITWGRTQGRRKTEILARKSPANCYPSRNQMEWRYYDNWRIDPGASYIEFVEPLVVGGIPIAIPFVFDWNHK